jgi:hypothetical protein
MRIIGGSMRTKRCERCPDEDTDVCEDCTLVKQDMEDKLKNILEAEEKRIRGD